MTLRRIAFRAATLALLIVAAALVLLFTADLGFLKAQIEDHVTAVSGRKFSIEGDLSVRLGRRAIVIADDIHWHNATWAEGGDMLRAGRFEIEVDLLSILRGPFVIERVALRNARVVFTRNTDDESNWDVFDRSTEPAPPIDSSRGFMLREMDVSDVAIQVTGPARPVPLNIEIRSLRQAVNEEDMLFASLEGSSNGRKLSLVAEFGTWTTLLERGPFDYELEARLDRVVLSSNGHIDSLAEIRRPDFHFSFKGPAISELFVLVGLGEHGVGDVNLEGSLSGADDSPLVLDIAGNLGETTIEATGWFSDLQNLQHADLSFRANGPDLGRILSLFGINQVSEVPFALALDLDRNGPLMNVRQAEVDIGDARLSLQAQLPEFPGFDNAVASARVEGPEIQRLKRLLPVPHGISGPFRVSLDLDATSGEDEAFRIEAQIPLVRLAASGSLGPAPQHFGSAAQFHVEVESLANIGAVWGLTGFAHVPVTLAGELELTANGVRVRDGTIAAIGVHTANIEGVIGTTADFRGSDLTVTMRGESVADFGRAVYPVRGLPIVPYELRAHVVIDDAGYRLQPVTSKIGESNLQLSGLVSRQRGLAGSRVSASLEGPALEALVPVIGRHTVRPGFFRLSGEAVIETNIARFNGVRFEREFADITADLELPWPLTFYSADFAIRGRGRDVRELIGGVGLVQLAGLPYSIDVTGNRRGTAWTISGTGLKLGDAEARVRGALDYGDAVNATRLTIDAMIPSLASLGTIDGRHLRDSPLGLRASFTRHDDSLTASDLRIDVDEGTIGGIIAWRPGGVPALHIELRSDHLALRRITEAQAVSPELDRHSTDERLIPDVAIPFDALPKVDVAFRLAIDRFERELLQVREVSMFAELKSGALTLHELGFRGKSGRFLASALLEPAGGAGYAKVDVMADGLRLDLNADDEYEGMTVDLIARLEASGMDLRALAGNANGVLLLDARDGRLRRSPFLDAVYGDLLDEIVSTINPFTKTGEYTQVECIVVPAEIAAGRVVSAPRTLILTDKIRMLSENHIDLKTEAIDLYVRTTPSRSLSVSAAEILNPYFKVAGTLAAPRLAVDRKGLVVSGGAAIATGGLSVLAKATWDRLSKTDDPCALAVAEGRKALTGRLGTSD